ncbi:heat shock 70 kDa protein 12A-like [Mytilus trossulus]|uniref:heat shock 70 kDa protein 12A-like n=1 Tax=Mytilus trossulus TaxID=6551 RepID=UPI0030051D93
MAHLGNPLFVVGIDFGTTYSGYAFSSKADPSKISTNIWQGSKLLSLKAPTAVLLNNNQEFEAFGYEAEKRFSELLADEEQDDYYYFHQFKMLLHNNNQRIQRSTKITDYTGKSMEAIKVFGLVIKFLKEQLINKFRDNVNVDDFYFVLTVPAMWDDPAKQFMREAAETAGIQVNMLTIALEPEVTSVYCREYMTDRDIKGMKYVVVDLGGGTADIAVYQQHPDDFLEEVVPPSGGAWGGIAIDDAYLRFLEKVFGEGVMQELKLKEFKEYTDLIHEFEDKKRLIKSDTTTDVVITIPVGFMDIIKKQCGGTDAAIKKSPYSDSLCLRDYDSLWINPQKFRDLFKPTINSLLKHLEQLFQHPKVSDIQDIIMVGGFSKCELVQRAMEDKFPKKKIIIPELTDLAVLRGAVLYGHQHKPIRRYKLFVVAIDFGTTYSGYAFSTKSQPNSIYTCDWRRSSLLSYKAPTSVLLNHKKEFLAFGYDAETKYMSSLENDSDDEDSEEAKEAVYYYFRRFKMALYNESVDIDSLIKDESGFKMKAIDIFTFAIKYLKDQTINKLRRTLTDVDIADIHYVLTVPAIWEDKAKMFMRKSAEKAGIKGYQLTIALEPEAASIYCQELRTDRENKTNITFSETIKEGMKYVVVDLGGGTADITVHEILTDGLLEEVVPPSSGAWGGTAIDDAYLRFLEKVFGEKVVQELKLKELEDYTELIHEFEVKKRSIKTDTTDDVVITMPVGFIDIIKKHCGGIDTAIKKSPYSDSISISGQRLRVNPQKFRNLFKPTINSLLKHLEQLFRHPKVSDIQYIIMVGGFSECELVQKEMKDKFPKKKIIIPEEAGLAVLKGAVLYGHQPEKIKTRILKKTYGIQSWPEWDSEVHPETKRVRIEGTDRCKDVFYKFAVKGEKVEAGHSYGQIFQALKPDERTLECTVYISDDTNPRYVTDPSCQRLGNLIVPLPPLNKGQSLEIEETMIFGGTELLFRAKNMKTGEFYETQFQF